jgi:hypothetical protein
MPEDALHGLGDGKYLFLSMRGEQPELLVRVAAKERLCLKRY